MVTASQTFSGWLPTLLPGTMQQQLGDALLPWLDALKRAAEKSDLRKCLPGAPLDTSVIIE
jgi:hypothetical protein